MKQCLMPFWWPGSTRLPSTNQNPSLVSNPLILSSVGCGAISRILGMNHLQRNIHSVIEQLQQGGTITIYVIRSQSPRKQLKDQTNHNFISCAVLSILNVRTTLGMALRLFAWLTRPFCMVDAWYIIWMT